MANSVLRKLVFWQEQLPPLSDYKIRLQFTPMESVTVEGRGYGHHFVGVLKDGDRSAVIITTRKLREDDVLHELIHLWRPEWDHEMVVNETESLIASRNEMYKNRGERF